MDKPIIIYLTRMPILSSFKPTRRIELLRTGVFSPSQTFVNSPVWEGGDLYPMDDSNWDKYLECIKNNTNFDWETIS